MKRPLVLLPITVLSLVACGAPAEMGAQPPPTVYPAPTSPGMFPAPKAPPEAPKYVPCSGAVLEVPTACKTIQEAVDVAIAAPHGFPAPLTTILVSPGTYRETVAVSGGVNILIAPSDDNGQVIIDGGARSAVTVTDGDTMLSLWNISCQSKQVNSDYTSATIFAEFAYSLKLSGVMVNTASRGLTVNYVGDVEVAGSGFVGDGSPSSIGIDWDHADSGSRIFNNVLQHLQIGINRCSGNVPKLGVFGSDSNTYRTVVTPYFFDAACN